jgi:HD-like signal output (HDOD) protein
MPDEATQEIRGLLRSQLQGEDLALPLLPQVANRVIELTSDPDASASQISELIHSDAALAGQVLRIANSAAYVSQVEIVTLQQAVTRLGFRVLGEIALSASLKDGVFNVTGYEGLVANLWRRAMASGHYAKEIARLRRRNVEAAFLCGLLHEVGRCVVLNDLTGVPTELRDQLTDTAVDGLLDEFELAFGQALAVKWKLPEVVHFAIRYYRDVEQAKDCQQEVLLTSLAHGFSRWLVGDADETEISQHPVLPQLNIYPDELEALMNKRSAIETAIEAVTS